jgi:hypothetical protein
MTSWVLLGAGFGIGVWMLLIWAAPPRIPLSGALARLREPAPRVALVAPHDRPSRPVRLGLPLAGVLRAAGLPSREVRRDLAVAGRDIDAYLAEQAVCTLAGILGPPAAAALLALAGAPLGPSVPFVGAVLLGVIGFVTPVLQTRAAASRRRRDFRYALSAYLDLVQISLAAGAGVDGALAESATVGDGWAFTHLHRALEAARVTRTSPWTTLRQLGDDLNISELSELAASASLAGTEGAKIRASLAPAAGGSCPRRTARPVGRGPRCRARRWVRCGRAACRLNAAVGQTRGCGHRRRQGSAARQKAPAQASTRGAPVELWRAGKHTEIMDRA